MTAQQDVRSTDRYVSLFGDLMCVREQGLLERRYLCYWTHISLAVGAFAAIWVGFFMLGDSWWQLGLAAHLRRGVRRPELRLVARRSCRPT